MIKPQTNKIEYVKFYFITIAITGVSLLLTFVTGFSIYGWLRFFMGLFFIVFALFKFAGYKDFTLMFSGYDLIAQKYKPYAYLYPFIELLLGLLYLTNIVPFARDLFTFVIMLIGGVGVVITNHKHHGIQCACLGNIIKLPLSTTTIVEDFGMAAMALIMLCIR